MPHVATAHACAAAGTPCLGTAHSTAALICKVSSAGKRCARGSAAAGAPAGFGLDSLSSGEKRLAVVQGQRSERDCLELRVDRRSSSCVCKGGRVFMTLHFDLSGLAGRVNPTTRNRNFSTSCTRDA
eukprot:516167-Rhodomonas_salina.1